MISAKRYTNTPMAKDNEYANWGMPNMDKHHQEIAPTTMMRNDMLPNTIDTNFSNGF